jgi:hypothetical protein
MELSFCAVTEMSALLDAHVDMTGAALLGWRVEKDSEDISDLGSKQGSSALLAPMWASLTGYQASSPVVSELAVP